MYVSVRVNVSVPVATGNYQKYRRIHVYKGKAAKRQD